MELKKGIREWQKILRLLDWDITSEYIHPAQIDGSAAKVNVSIPRKHAHIRVQDPKVPPNPDIFTFDDQEHLIVHELLHIHFEPFFPEDEDSLEYEMAEQCVDQLAKAFVALKRGKV